MQVARSLVWRLTATTAPNPKGENGYTRRTRVYLRCGVSPIVLCCERGSEIPEGSRSKPCGRTIEDIVWARRGESGLYSVCGGQGVPRAFRLPVISHSAFISGGGRGETRRVTTPAAPLIETTTGSPAEAKQSADRECILRGVHAARVGGVGFL